jgi:hypothetical protein
MHWGDVPTWIAVFIAAIGGGIALYQLRQQRLVIEGEVERNKRRDELLDGQLSELRERAADRVREQAEGVTASWDDETMSGGVYNGSRRPISKVVAGMAESLPDGGTNTHQTGQWRTYNRAGAAMPLSSPAVAVIRPDKGAECLFEPSQLQGENRRLVVRFCDDADRRWQLDQFMHLEPAPDDGW